MLTSGRGGLDRKWISDINNIIGKGGEKRKIYCSRLSQHAFTVGQINPNLFFLKGKTLKTINAKKMNEIIYLFICILRFIPISVNFILCQEYI